MNAQSNFIEPLTKQGFLSGNAKLPLYQRLLNDPDYVAVTPIRLNDLWAFQSMGELTFTLPGVTDPIHARVTTPRRFSATKYEWAGEIIDSTGLPIGRAVFFRKGDRNYGRITLPGRRFVIRDLDAGVPDDQVLIEYAAALVDNGDCGTEETGTPPPGPGDPPAEFPPPPSCVTTIRILFLYTQMAADSSAIDMESKADLAVIDLNETLRLSAIPDTEVEAIVAGVELISTIGDSTGNGITIRNSLASNPEADSLRIAHNADLVLLYQVTDMFYIHPITAQVRDIGGIAYINDVNFQHPTPDVNLAYSVMEVDQPVTTFTHEIGHLLGCRHLPGQDIADSFAKANRFCLTPAPGGNCQTYRATIMAGGVENLPERISRFSNPDPAGAYQGATTGTEDQNNARMIGQTACHVGQFGESLGGQLGFAAFISGPYTVYQTSDRDFTYSSYYQNCQGSVNYNWEVSYDYQATWQQISTAASATIDGDDIPMTDTLSRVYLKLTASCSNGNSYTHFYEALNFSFGNLREGDSSDVAFTEKSKIDTESAAEAIQIYPNPARGAIYLQSELKAPEYGELALIDAAGKVEVLYTGLVVPRRPLSFTVQRPAGYYTLAFRTASAVYHKPLIIAQ